MSWLWQPSVPGSSGAVYTLSAESGSYGITGQAVNLLAARKLSAASGSYTIAGQAANLRAARKLSAASGVYTLTGSDASLRKGFVMAAVAGVYAIVGQAVNLLRSVRLVAAAGAYAITGQAVNLKVNRILRAAAGAYAITGQDASLRKGFVMAAAAGVYAIAGQAVNLLRNRRLLAASGAYAITGSPVGLLWNRRLRAESGSYSITGSSVNLVHGTAWGFHPVTDLADVRIEGTTLDDVLARSSVLSDLALVGSRLGSISIVGTTLALAEPVSPFLDGLALHLTLDEVSGDRFDSTPSGLSLAETIAAVASAAGKIDTAARFVFGAGQGFLKSSSALLTLSQNPAVYDRSWTLAFGFKTTNNANNMGLFSHGGVFGANVAKGAGQGDLTWQVGNSNGATTGLTVHDGLWHHVFVGFDAPAQRSYIRFDDLPEIVSSGGASVPYDDGAFRLGTGSGEGQSRFAGDMDEVVLWPTRKLSTDEQDELLNGGDWLTYPYD